MPSWQARVVMAVRALLRRRDWGDRDALTRRARRLFGAPRLYQKVVMLGLEHEPVHSGKTRGEWIVPPAIRPGVILYLHGGGFVSCSPATHRPITAALARKAQRRVFSVDYRLAPEHPFPAALDDVLAAYEWLLETGVPSSAVALAGDSAGGNLAVSLVLRLRDTGRPQPACVVVFSPFTDLAARGRTVLTNDGRDPMFRSENLPAFASAYLEAVRPDDPAASPAYAVLSDLPPMLVHVGSTELLLDDARRMHSSICSLGGSSRLHVYDDVAHCWQMFAWIVPEATESLREAAAFIEQYLGGEAGGGAL
jgi:monoterpene epsilon-lactone hydrolase